MLKRNISTCSILHHNVVSCKLSPAVLCLQVDEVTFMCKWKSKNKCLPCTKWPVVQTKMHLQNSILGHNGTTAVFDTLRNYQWKVQFTHKHPLSTMCINYMIWDAFYCLKEVKIFYSWRHLVDIYRMLTRKMSPT